MDPKKEISRQRITGRPSFTMGRSQRAVCLFLMLRNTQLCMSANFFPHHGPFEPPQRSAGGFAPVHPHRSVGAGQTAV